MATYTPPGWPAGVHPPGSDDFESTAVGWLLEVVPPDYRLHGVLRRYPVALASMARYHSKACVEGARQGYRTARTDLAGSLPPHAIDTVLAAYRKEGAGFEGTGFEGTGFAGAGFAGAGFAGVTFAGAIFGVKTSPRSARSTSPTARAVAASRAPSLR